MNITNLFAITGPEENRRELIIVRYLFFAFYSGLGIFVIYSNPYYRSIGLAGSQIGWIATFSPLATMLANPLWGLISDRFGKARELLLIAPVVTGLAAFGIAQAESFIMILLLAVLFAAFFQPVNSLISTLALTLLEDDSQDFGRQRLWGTIGFIITAFSFGFLLERTGLRFLFYGYIGAAVLFFIGALMLGPQQVSVGSDRSTWAILGTMVKNRSWVFFMLSVILTSSGISAMNVFIGVYMLDLGAPEGLIGTAQAIPALSELPVLLLGGVLIRRFGTRRLLLVGTFFYVIRWALYGIMPSPVWAIPIGLIHSISFGPFIIAGVDYAHKLAPPEFKATSQGVFYGAWSLSQVLTSRLSGQLYDTVGGSGLYLFYAGIGILSLIILLLGTRPIKPKVTT